MSKPITEPGIYFDVPAADYFADPLPSPSLTQSIAKTLIKSSPAHAWLQQPRLNPRFKPCDPKKYDLGSIAHALLLGRGKELAVIEGDDWVADRKAKSEKRAEALARGKLCVLSRDYAVGAEMARAALQQLDQRGFGEDWQPFAGKAEVVIAWRDRDLWFRAMIDWLSNDRRRVWDYKTTAASASPYDVDWRVTEDGWDIQAAMHEFGLNALDPKNAGRREHRFVIQENTEPYALTVVRLPESVLTIGRKKLACAEAMWRACVESGQWPGYPLDEHVASYPGSAEARWIDRELAEQDAPPNRGGMLPSLMGG